MFMPNEMICYILKLRTQLPLRHAIQKAMKSAINKDYKTAIRLFKMIVKHPGMNESNVVENVFKLRLCLMAQPSQEMFNGLMPRTVLMNIELLRERETKDDRFTKSSKGLLYCDLLSSLLDVQSHRFAMDVSSSELKFSKWEKIILDRIWAKIVMYHNNKISFY